MKKLRYTLTGAAIIAAAVATTACSIDKPKEYDPEYNENVTVYGPPEEYNPEDNKNEDVYGPPEELDSIR